MIDDRELRRTARECQRTLESAQFHMMAHGPIKHLNAYGFANQVWGMAQVILDNLDSSSEYFKQFQGFVAKSVAISEQFEREFQVVSVTTESGKQLTMAPVLDRAVVPTEDGTPKPVQVSNGFETTVRKLLVQKPAAHPHRKGARSRSARLETHERVAIWDHFNGKNPAPKTYREYVAVAEIYNVTPMTVQRWAENNPTNTERRSM